MAMITLTTEELSNIVNNAVAQALAQAQAPAQKPAKPAKTVSNSAKSEVKKAPKEPKKAQKPAPDVTGKRYGYRVIADVDTRDNSPLWVVKVLDSLDREEYLEEQKQMKALGAYYSRFKGGFIFRYDPSSALKAGKAPKGAPRAEYVTKKGAKRV